MTFFNLPKHRSLQEKKDTLQPYKFKKNIGKFNINEDFIKNFGADNHPDPEVKDFYKKKGY